MAETIYRFTQVVINNYYYRYSHVMYRCTESQSTCISYRNLQFICATHMSNELKYIYFLKCADCSRRNGNYNYNYYLKGLIV